MFVLRFTKSAALELKSIDQHASRVGLAKQVKKTLGYLQVNPKHPSLKTHSYQAIDNPFDSTKKVFEAYVQNNTLSAYRVFWCYGPSMNEITIIAITPHP